MTEGDLIQKQLRTIIKEKFRRHICSILYGKEQHVGTGNLLKHNGQLFILTCHHVATEACSSKNFEVIFTNNIKVNGDQISLFRKHKGDDIALLKIESNLELEELIPLTLGEFANSSDLRVFSRSNLPFVVVVGFPASLVEHDNSIQLRSLRPLIFQTMPPIGKRQTKAKIYLEYQPGSADTPKLPDAPGLSGAGIWYVTPLGQNDHIISPTHWKFIAIQSTWKPGEYIVGKRLREVFKWLT